MRFGIPLLVGLIIPIHANAIVYHVSQDGDDGNDGTADAPFLTIGACAEVATAGDVCRVHAGTYRESVVPPRDGTASAPIRFEAAPGECVTVSGTESFSDVFALHDKDIWVAQTSEMFNQLFWEGAMLPEARWPNRVGTDLQERPLGQTADGTDKEALVDPEIPDGDWTGAMVFILPGEEWQSDTRRIASFDSVKKRIVYDAPIGAEPSIEPRAGNRYYLFDSLLAVDAPGEWYLDADKGKLYFVPPAGQDPNTLSLEIKRRTWAFDVSGRSHIEVAGFRIFGSAIRLSDAHHCTVDGINARYVSHLRETDSYYTVGESPMIDGTHNVWKNSTIAHSATAGLLVAGNDNRVENNVIYDVAYMATNRAGIDIIDQNARNERNQIIGNTVTRSGRAGIFLYGSRAGRVLYNRVSAWGLQTRDMGGIYVWGTDGEGTEIAFNEVFDGQCDWCVGIYLDDASRRFTVHHNDIHDVLWYGVKLKHENAILNNTIRDVAASPISVDKNFQTNEWQLEGGFCVNNLDDGDPRLKVGINTADVTDYGVFEAVTPVTDSEKWHHVTVPFDTLVQPAWAIPVEFDPSVAVTLHFSPLTYGTSTLEIDNVRLEGDGASLLVDDFEDGDNRTAIGGHLWSGGGEGAEATGKVIEGGAGGSEMAYRLESTLPIHGWAVFVLTLGATENTPVDISMYDTLSFDVRGESRSVLMGPAEMPYQAQNAVCEVDDDLTPASGCVDKGVDVSPFTEGFRGDGPDIGAVEAGATRLNTGANFQADWDQCDISDDADWTLPPWHDYPDGIFDTDTDSETETGTDNPDTMDGGDTSSPQKKSDGKESGCGCRATGQATHRHLIDLFVALSRF